LRVHGHELRQESGFGALVLDDWQIGGINSTIGLLQVMDYEKWSQLEVSFTRADAELLAAAILITICGLLSIAACWRYVNRTSTNCFEKAEARVVRARGFIFRLNAGFATYGCGIIVFLFLWLAFGPMAIDISFSDVFELATSGQYPFIPLSVAAGLAFHFLGCFGMAVAKSRAPTPLLVYLIGMALLFFLQYKFTVGLGGLDALVHFGDDATWKSIDELTEITERLDKLESPLTKASSNSFETSETGSKTSCRAIKMIVK
jgi:hypothetical protein